MRIRIALFVSITILAALPLRSQADEKPAEEPVNHFASPWEAFKAYRLALNKHDWRAFYYCQTPKGRDDAVCEQIAFLTPDEDKPEVIALRKKYGIELGVIEEEFMRRYGQKHRVDVTKDIADMKLEVARIQAGKKDSRSLTGDVDKTDDASEANSESKDSSDDELWSQAVLARISDKVGFYDDSSKTLIGNNKTPAEGLSDLREMTIKGDTAKGFTRTIQEYPPPPECKKPQKITITEEFTFHKLKDGWFVESRTVTTDGWTNDTDHP